MSRTHAGFAPLLGLEAVAIIAYVYFQRLFIFQQRQADFVRGGMLLHVVKGLNRDAIERRLRLAR